MKERIRERARELGFDDCRFASAGTPESAPRLDQWLAAKRHGEMTWLERNAAKRRDPQLVLPGARSVITLVASYHRETAQALPIRPQNAAHGAAQSQTGVIARYARHTDYHDVMAGPLKTLAEFVEGAGGPEARALWYVDTGPVLERDFAQLSGAGFIGKHTNLISRHLGNWILLGEILTTLELEPDMAEKNRCGTCTRCIEVCPTQAITAPFQLDARLCISYLTIELKGSIPEALRPAVGNRIFGCDDCLAACPWNRFAREGRLMKEHARHDFDSADLLELLALDETQFKQRFAGTPILRTKRRGLLRNVCVALGNIGGKEALPALEKAASDPEPLIAEHARWALREISSRTQQPEG